MTLRLIQNWNLATLKAQILADRIFVIYDLIKFYLTKKYSISKEKPYDLEEKPHKTGIKNSAKFDISESSKAKSKRKIEKKIAKISDREIIDNY